MEQDWLELHDVDLVISDLDTSKVFVLCGQRHRIWFGVAFIPRTNAWVIWASAQGHDVEGLSAWKSGEQAEHVLDSYLGAAAKGIDDLREAITRSLEMSGPGLSPYLTPEERQQLVGSIGGTAA